MIFDANEFLKNVATVKTFWLSSKLNKLRIEAHKDIKRMNFISINRDTGLETVVSIPAYVETDFVLHIKTVNSFYTAVELLQNANVGKNNPLNLRLVPNPEQKHHFKLEVLLACRDFAVAD